MNQNSSKKCLSSSNWCNCDFKLFFTIRNAQSSNNVYFLGSPSISIDKLRSARNIARVIFAWMDTCYQRSKMRRIASNYEFCMMALIYENEKIVALPRLFPLFYYSRGINLFIKFCRSNNCTRIEYKKLVYF